MTFRVMGRRRENPATNFLEDDAVEDRFAQIPAVRRRRGEQVRSTPSGSSRFSILATCTHSTFGRWVFTIGETGSAAFRPLGSTLPSI
jgi:hypothetical protein